MLKVISLMTRKKTKESQIIRVKNNKLTFLSVNYIVIKKIDTNKYNVMDI